MHFALHFAFSQEHFKTISYAKFGGQTECIMGDSKIVNDLEMESRKENRNNKRTEIERFHWFSERIQTRVTARVNFIAINGYFTLTSYCNTIGQSNNAFPY